MGKFKRFLSKSKKLARFAGKTLVEGRLNRREKDFIAHNKKVWGQFLPQEDSGEILLEFNGMASSIIAFSYLANLLAQMHQAKILAYQINKNFGALVADRKVKKIFQSFNVRDFIVLKLSPSQRQKVEELYRTIGPGLKTKKDVEDLQVEGLWIGDLLYDSHCMEYRVPTVELGSPSFQDSLKKALCAYVFWRDYLDVHRVNSFIVTHTVYVGSGVISRLAIQRGIAVYQINATHLYYMTEETFGLTMIFSYPEKFRSCGGGKAKRLLAAKERIQRRFAGEVRGYTTPRNLPMAGSGRKVLKESPAKILVATHCFFDSPIPLVSIYSRIFMSGCISGRISERTDYDWYIKTHPDFLPGNMPIIESLSGNIRNLPDTLRDISPSVKRGGHQFRPDGLWDYRL
jgi:hypothetical protein